MLVILPKKQVLMTKSLGTTSALAFGLYENAILHNLVTRPRDYLPKFEPKQ